MPNRMIKESIRTSRKVNALTDFQFRVWLYLITYVDDYGRGSADPELLKGLVFPRRKGITEAQISEALSDLANTGMVTLYEADGEPYFYFPNWSSHQRIQTKRSKFPDPPKPTVTHGESPPETKPNQLEIETNYETETSTNSLAQDALAEIMTYYMENISMGAPSGVVTAAIQSYAEELAPDVVLHAIQQAAERDVHTWTYIKAILDRYKASGLTTLEAVEMDERRTRSARDGEKPVHGVSGSTEDKINGSTGRYDFIHADNE